MHVADYRAAERTFSLLTQVCGRSGRARAGEAIVQTYSLDHPAIGFASKHDYDGFAREELLEPRALRRPPYTRVALLGAIGCSRRIAVRTKAIDPLRRDSSRGAPACRDR